MSPKTAVTIPVLLRNSIFVVNQSSQICGFQLICDGQFPFPKLSLESEPHAKPLPWKWAPQPARPVPQAVPTTTCQTGTQAVQPWNIACPLWAGVSSSERRGYTGELSKTPHLIISLPELWMGLDQASPEVKGCGVRLPSEGTPDSCVPGSISQIRSWRPGREQGLAQDPWPAVGRSGEQWARSARRSGSRRSGVLCGKDILVFLAGPRQCQRKYPSLPQLAHRSAARRSLTPHFSNEDVKVARGQD